MTRDLLNKGEQIQIGQRVYSGLYGGRFGVVYAIHGEQKPATIGTMAGVICYGGNADFDIVFDDGSESRRLPESIIWGVQWEVYREVASSDEIAAMRGFAVLESTRRADEAAEKARKHKEAVEALRKDSKYSHLKQAQGYTGAAFAAANIRAELKKTFPGVKFSVRSKSFSGGDSIDIGWTDGPRLSEVRAISDKYSAGHFNGMEDIYEYSRSAWTEVFGDAKYISCDRTHSLEALKEAVREVCMEYGWELLKVETHSYDGSAYLPCDNQDRYRTVYDWLEKRGQYQNRAA